MMWYRDATVDCKCTPVKPFDFRALCSNPEPAEKFEIEIGATQQKDTLTLILTTRAGFSQPKKFAPISIEANPRDTLGAVRARVVMAIHGATNVDTDRLCTHTLKAENGFLFDERLNETPMHTLMGLAGGDRHHGQVKLNMTVDGYGEGGGKRVSLTELIYTFIVFFILIYFHIFSYSLFHGVTNLIYLILVVLVVIIVCLHLC